VIYFDHNATSPLSRVARDAWISATERFPANPSSPHRLGSRAEAALDDARRTVAGQLGCSEFDIVWTSGATEANNAVFHHAAMSMEGEAWVSAIEHPSVLAAAQRWFPGKVRLLGVAPEGVIDLHQLADQLKSSRPSLVSAMAANNETGVQQPWREVLALCRQYDVPFACDAAQWIGKVASAGLGRMRLRCRLRAQVWRPTRRRIPQSPGFLPPALGGRPAGRRSTRGDGEPSWHVGHGGGLVGARVSDVAR
jgi:cysteine desulfurase